MNYRCITVAVLILFLGACYAGAAVSLFDFETDEEIALLEIRTPSTDTLKRSSQYATSGSFSVQFYTPKWEPEMEEWPAFNAIPTVKDWSKFDRLIVDITNPTPDTPLFSAFISDSKTPFRKGYNHFFVLPQSGFKRFVVDLNLLKSAIDSTDVSIVHFFTERPKELHLYIDNITLLEPGEELPPLPVSFLKETTKFMKPMLQRAEVAVENCERSFSAPDSALTMLKIQLGELRSALKNPEAALDTMSVFDKKVDELVGRAGKLESLENLKNSCRKLGIPCDPMAIGFADSMNKILPRSGSFNVKAAKSVSLSAARNEKESIQVAVVPSGLAPLRGVCVSVTDLRTAAGDVLDSSNIDCDVMGYVETKNQPPYEVSYIGWWPDPILNFLGPVDIKPGDVQTFWVRVRVPKGQKPGLYKGTLAVSAYGAESVKFGFSVKVRTFTMPDVTPIPTATTMFPPGPRGEHARNEIVGYERWHSQVKYEYADFLADYYLEFDSLYDPGPPDFDILKYKRDKGNLVAFNYGQFYGDVKANIDKFTPIYQKCKELGINHNAYIYGFDEVSADKFPELENAAKALKEAFPDIFVLTTAYDNSYGLDSVVKSMDGWTPLTPVFDPEQAKKSRAEGKKVWWYICCSPRNPYANWFVDYQAIEARLLMGAMTAKYRPDGFLYYSLVYWNDNGPITSGPFTTWDPVSWKTYHGDGSLFCYGEGGKLIPTIRIENYRDGMEDVAYVLILQDIIGKYEAKGNTLTKVEKKWLAKAKKVLEVPDSLVTDMANYSHDSNLLYKWREAIANMIDSSGMPDADPWGKNFGVRGFDNR